MDLGTSVGKRAWSICIPGPDRFRENREGTSAELTLNSIVDSECVNQHFWLG
jgi:hypothetical protein